MVNTRSSSRAPSPVETGYVPPEIGDETSRRLRARSRRSSTPARGGTPSRRGRSKPQNLTAGSGARSGISSNAYGTASGSVASRVTGREQNSLSSALNSELVSQEAPRATPALAPVIEEDARSSRISSRASSRASSVSNTGQLNEKSYSHQREAGVIHPNDQPDQTEDSTAITNDGKNKSFSNNREAGVVKFPPVLPTRSHYVARSNANAPSFFTRLYATIQDFFTRLFASIIDLVTKARDFTSANHQLLIIMSFALFLAPMVIYGLFSARSAVTRPDDDVFDSPHAPSAPYQTFTKTVTSYNSGPTIRHLSSRLDACESRLSSVESDIKFLKKTNSVVDPPPYNHISASRGATILPHITSPTKARVSGWLAGALSKLWTPPSQTYPIEALRRWEEAGECWCTPADKAALGVRAPYPMQAGAVTIEHVRAVDLAGSGADLTTAPRVVEVFARGEGQGSEGCREERNGWVCLGRLFAAFGRDARSVTLDLDVKTVVSTDFAFVVVENGGSEEATCLYRVQLHGNVVVA